MIQSGFQTEHNFTDANNLIRASYQVSNSSNTALLTPDSGQLTKAPWSTDTDQGASDYSIGLFADTPWCARGDDLDDDEAYFLDDEEDDDDDTEDDYDDEDDEDDDEDRLDKDSDDEEDDEVL